MTNVVSFCRALADTTRWRIVQMAMTEALCVCELADVLDMPQSSVSSHVQVLRRAGLLESERCEKWTYFRILPSYQALIHGLVEHFPSADESVTLQDQVRLKRRLKERAGSCCPGPQKLAGAIPSNTSKRTKR